jgi:hypothetical protein
MLCNESFSGVLGTLAGEHGGQMIDERAINE